VELVQDFLTPSNLESGRVEWHLESLSLEEYRTGLQPNSHCALTDALPQVTIQVPAQLPLVRADGDWLVEVLSKLLTLANSTPAPEGHH